MVTGEDVINAMKSCNDNCQHCAASIKGRSCKEYRIKLAEWQDKKHKEFQMFTEGFTNEQ